jgi:hypothetical protein
LASGAGAEAGGTPDTAAEMTLVNAAKSVRVKILIVN